MLRQESGWPSRQPFHSAQTGLRGLPAHPGILTEEVARFTDNSSAVAFIAEASARPQIFSPNAGFTCSANSNSAAARIRCSWRSKQGGQNELDHPVQNYGRLHPAVRGGSRLRDSQGAQHEVQWSSIIFCCGRCLPQVLAHSRRLAVLQAPLCPDTPTESWLLQDYSAFWAAAAAAAEAGDQLVLLCCRLLFEEPSKRYTAAVSPG